MVSLAERPRKVNFTNHVYGPCGDGKTDDKPFLHKEGATVRARPGRLSALSVLHSKSVL